MLCIHQCITIRVLGYLPHRPPRTVTPPRYPTTYRAAERCQTLQHLLHVSCLEQVDCLEDVFVGDSVRLDGLLEGGVVLHQHEVTALLVDSLYAARHDLVHQPAVRTPYAHRSIPFLFTPQGINYFSMWIG